MILLVALLSGSSALFFLSAGRTAAQGDEIEDFGPKLGAQLAGIYQQKQSLTPAQRKIDSSILQVVDEIEERVLAAAPGDTLVFGDLSTPRLRADEAGSMEVKLTVSSLTDGQLEQLQALGMDVKLTLPEYGVVEGNLPYGQVEAVAELDFVVNVGTPSYPLLRMGDVTSAGDKVLRAAEARAAFGADGSGIKIGVISDGVDYLSNSVASGDLPSSPAVDVLKAGDGNEGTAMLEIIHDLAPGASLAFYGVETSSDMVAGIQALEAAGCDIIVDDIGFSDEPMFEDGPIAQEARAFFTGGGVYVTAAGNSADTHYMATYVRSAGSPSGGYAYAHDYGGGDLGNTLTIPDGRGILVLLQWNNQWGQAADDFDGFIAPSSGGTVLGWSTDTQDGDDNPYEFFYWFNNTGSSVPVAIAVYEYGLVSAPSSLVLEYFVWYGSGLGLQYVMPEDSMWGHPEVEEVLSTAAADAATPDTIEYYSSRGPGIIHFPTYEERQVPNITGVDGVYTKTGELGYFPDPFYGTSAAAPHVAAIAALVWDADPTLSSSAVFNAITSTAVDRGAAGWDSTWGFGRIDAYEAVASVAVPDITVTPTAKDFGSVVISTSSSPQTITVTNDGSADLTVGTITKSGTDAAMFTIQNDYASGQTLSPSASATLQVVFSPTSTGSKSAALSIPSDDPDEATVDVSLSGTGVVPPAPDITVSPSSLAFMWTEVGSSSSPKTVTITNDGNANLIMGTATIGGTDATLFVIQNDSVSGQTISAGNSATLQVVFSPTTITHKSATLYISSNDPDESPATLAMTGIGKTVPVGVGGEVAAVDRAAVLGLWAGLALVLALAIGVAGSVLRRHRTH